MIEKEEIYSLWETNVRDLHRRKISIRNHRVRCYWWARNSIWPTFIWFQYL